MWVELKYIVGTTPITLNYTMVKGFFARRITKVQSVVHNYNYLLALLLKHSLRTSICVCKYLYMVSDTNSVFHHFPLRGRWPWLLCRPHQVHGHFKQPWIFMYYPWKWLFLSGCWWCQFSIIDYRTGNSHNCIHTYARMLTFCVTAIMYYIIINLPYAGPIWVILTETGTACLKI